MFIQTKCVESISCNVQAYQQSTNGLVMFQNLCKALFTFNTKITDILYQGLFSEV